MYENIPPIYERIPSIARKRNGELNLEDQIIKRSGGIIPRRDSEIKNTVRINASEKLLKIYWNRGFKSMRYLAINIMGIRTRNQMIIIFNAVHHIYPYNPLFLLL
jgi:hypothetical protein